MSAIGNIISRLGGLKNVSGRRVMPGAEYLEELEAPETDLEGTSPIPEFSNFLPQNQPEAETGVPVSPQSYDVRANTVQSTEQMIPEQQESILSRLGKYLSEYAQKPAEGANLPFVPKTEPRTPPVFEGANLPFVPKASVAQTPPIETAEVQASEGLPATTASEEVQAVESPQKELGAYAEVGASKKILDNPQLKSEIERIFDVSMTPEMEKELSTYEKVLDTYNKELQGITEHLNEREKAIKDRIDSRQLTTQDKLLMAVALIAPVALAGLTMGKEGLAGVLGGGAKGLAEVLGGRQKEQLADEEKLDELALTRGKIGKEMMGTTMEVEEKKNKLLQSVPNKALKDLFQRDGKVIDNKLVLDTGNPLLPLKSTKIRDTDDLKRFKEKDMPDLEENIGRVQTSMNIVDSLDKLLEAAQKQEKSGIGGVLREYTPLSIYDVGARAVKSYIPAARDTLVDEEGNQIKISELFNTYREALMDNYRKLFTGNTAQKSAQEHFFRAFPNPFEKEAFKEGRGNVSQTAQQLKIVKNMFEDVILHSLESKGVETKPMRDVFASTQTSKKESEKQRKKERANTAVKQALGNQ